MTSYIQPCGKYLIIDCSVAWSGVTKILAQRTEWLLQAVLPSTNRVKSGLTNFIRNSTKYNCFNPKYNLEKEWHKELEQKRNLHPLLCRLQTSQPA